MTATRTHPSYLAIALCTALLGLGSLALPAATIAADNDKPEPVPPPAASQSAAVPSSPSSSTPLAVTTGGAPVISRDSPQTSAWCDPFSTDACPRHPWTNGAQGD